MFLSSAGTSAREAESDRHTTRLYRLKVTQAAMFGAFTDYVLNTAYKNRSPLQRMLSKLGFPAKRS